jgi:hypothetical protein
MVLTLLLHSFDHTQTVLATFSRRFENISSDVQMGSPGVSLHQSQAGANQGR